ncbi:tetratricopeptide repeat protein [Roseibacterium sp. SDUM158016]|uniref:tetratricopeptide repeat protein n=1 Tax=Roseicyclus sediminis TaxID=2980997 RepID=UPI0021D26469|nr:tetratricopeptide repeat protein [Roseibacterium sp. SDUM158016]MCU4652543.1 tetratricopeptide repeat protein [Roseibacterium sp. SDUM158016]
MPLARPLTSAAAAFAIAFVAAAPAPAQTTSGLAGPYLAARLAVIEGDHREAAAYFERALGADPGNALLISNAIFANAALGNWDAAAAIAAELAPGASGQELAGLVTFVDIVRQGDLAGARAAIEAGRGAGPFVDELALGWIALGEGTMDRAEEVFLALTEDPALSELAWLHLGLARAAVGDFETAEEILSGERAGRISQTERIVRARAEILVQLDRRGDALDLLDGYTQRVPDPALLALQARIGAGAEGPYSFVTTAQEGIAEVFFTVAQAFGLDNSSRLPLIYARAARGIAPGHTDAAILAAQMLMEDDQYALAAETYATVPEGDDQAVEARMGQAEALERQGEAGAALDVLQSLSADRPDLASVHAALADMLRRADRCAEAIDSYTAALDLVDTTQDRYWFMFYARAICYHDVDDWPPAEADFRYALELNPGQPQVLNYLGYSLVEQRRNLDEALGMIEQAVAAEPESGYIVDSLAWVYYRLGRFDEAVEPMERAVELLPTDPIVNDHLGDVYWMVGRHREARFQWERALSLEPADEDATRIRLKLEIGLDQVLEQEGGVGGTQ